MFDRFHRKSDTCARCKNTLGLRSHEPEEEYWGFDGKLCNHCYDLVRTDIQPYDATYIIGIDRLPSEIEGHLSVLLFDQRNTIVFSPKKKSSVPLEITQDLLTDCKIINRSELSSMKRRIFTAGISKTKDKRYLQIDFLEGGKEHVSILFDLHDKIDLACNTISLIKSAKTEDGEEIEHDSQSKPALDVGHQQQQELIMDQKTFCSSCEAPNELEAHFCSRCGNKLFVEESAADEPPARPLLETFSAEQEKAYFKAEGQVIVRRTEHRGVGRKIGSWLVAGPIGYVAIGRDKTRKTKAEGTLVVAGKAIYCAGNVYPYDKVLAFTRKRKSILLLFEKSFNEQRFSVTLELKTEHSKELFRALEIARMSKIKF